MEQNQRGSSVVGWEGRREGREGREEGGSSGGERGWGGKGKWEERKREREGRRGRGWKSNLPMVNVLHLCPMRRVVPLELSEMRLTIDSKCS